MKELRKKNLDLSTSLALYFRLTDKEREIIENENQRKADAIEKLKRDMEIKKEIRERIKNNK